MRALVPFLEHRRDTAFARNHAVPRTMTAVHMSPARAPEHKAEGSHREEEQEQRDEQAEATKAKPEWADARAFHSQNMDRAAGAV